MCGEGVRRTGGGRREEEKEGGADTELKTKTPHVNVGNMCWMRMLVESCAVPLNELDFCFGSGIHQRFGIIVELLRSHCTVLYTRK